MVHCTCFLYSPLMMGITGNGLIGSPFRGCEYTCKNTTSSCSMFSAKWLWSISVHSYTLSIACGTNVQYAGKSSLLHTCMRGRSNRNTRSDVGGLRNVIQILFIVYSILTPIHQLHGEFFHWMRCGLLVGKGEEWNLCCMWSKWPACCVVLYVTCLFFFKGDVVHWLFTHEPILVHTCSHTNTNTHMHINTCIHAHTHTNTHMHINTSILTEIR